MRTSVLGSLCFNGMYVHVHVHACACAYVHVFTIGGGGGGGLETRLITETTSL